MAMVEPDLAGAFLADVASPARPTIFSRVTVVLAHPDDETIGCGALLRRLPNAKLVLVTDGAPRNGIDARSAGFAGWADYAAARRGELLAALRLAGLDPDRLTSFDLPDQGAALDLAGLARRLVPIFAQADIVLTHAYEGGHPDHDAITFAVHAAARLAGSAGTAVVEMPFYHAGPEGWAVGRFVGDPDPAETVVRLDEREIALKRAMAAAHATQQRVLSLFGLDVERFRPAPAYDFTQLPNEGALLHEREGWGMTGERWSALARTALLELGL